LSQQPADRTARHDPNRIQFASVGDDTGVSFVHTDGGSGKRYIIEAMSGGVALFDYDADGDIDIYFLNGAPLPGTEADTTPRNALYRNDGDWKFVDVTAQSGTGDDGFGLGVAAADFDNDGNLDIYVNNYGPNVLYHNNGDGTFQQVTVEAGVTCGQKTGAGVAFLDINADGILDIYVVNYIRFSPDLHVVRTIMGVPSYPGPLDYEPEGDMLFRGNGDGTFTDISVESGIAGYSGTGMGLTCCDYDNDGDTDIFVANDVMANWLFQNDGTGRLTEVAIQSGVAFEVAGSPQASMGAEIGDFDNDGWFDFHVTSYQGDLATLYRNVEGLFVDATRLTRAGEGTLNDVTWGNGLVDFDNDGHRDIFIASGHIEDNINLRDRSASHPARNILLRNHGDGTFQNVTEGAGDGMLVKESSRGVAFDDLDGDGDVDAVVLNSGSKPTILRNDTNTQNHWLGLRLRGVTSNRFGIGARVRVITGDLTQIDEVRSGRGYQSHGGLQLHFGLGEYARVDRIEVDWLGGGTDVIMDVAADRVLTIVESQTESETR